LTFSLVVVHRSTRIVVWVLDVALRVPGCMISDEAARIGAEKAM
jgi:hypothetical protein